MNTSGIWNVRFKMGKIVLGLVLAAMIGSMDVAPASADDHRGRKEYRDNDRNEYRGRGYDRGRHGRHRRVYRTTTVYNERVYVPPPVVYAPPPEPGISIFFPPIVFRP